jgi:hypothetical protein
VPKGVNFQVVVFAIWGVSFHVVLTDNDIAQPIGLRENKSITIAK